MTNVCLQALEKRLPDCLKISRVTAFHCKKEVNLMLTTMVLFQSCLLSKVIEKIMTKQIPTYKEDSNFLVENQYWFS